MILTQKYFNNNVPESGELTDYDKETINHFNSLKETIENHLNQFKFREALKDAMNLARIGNKYLADTEPWKTSKTDMPRTATILNISLQITANLAIVFAPFLPFSVDKIKGFLNIDNLSWDQLGNMNLLPAGHALGKSELLFEKIEDEAIEQQMQKLMETKEANELKEYKAQPVKPEIAFDDFTKLDMRVATVLECERVPKTDKLLRFLLDDGIGKRTILSGIAEFYPNPEELVGKQVCFIANLAPRKMRGILSEGMILSAENADGTLSLIQPSSEVMPGSGIA